MNTARQLAWFGLMFAAGALASGCRFPGRDGPVPRSLIISRQLTQQGLSALDRNDWHRAEPLLAQAVDVFPQDAEARRHYATALWQSGQRAEALRQITKALELMPDDPTLLSRAAEMRLAVGETAAAADLVDRALDVDPRNAALWRLRGRLRLQAGALRESLADYQRALSYQPDDRDALLDVAEIYHRLNQPARALASLQTLSDGYPPGEEPPQVLYLMGLAYGALDRTDEAIDSFLAARDRGPSSPDLLFRLAEAQWSAGRLTEAQQNVSRALALAPGHAGSRALLQRMRLAGRGNQPTRR